MKHRNPLRSDKGFSLVELLVSVAILGVVTVPLLHTFITSTNTASKSRTLGEETLAAQNVAEKVEATALDSLGDLGSVTAYDGSTPPKAVTDPSLPAAEYDLVIGADGMDKVGVSGGKYSAKVRLTGTDEKEGTVYTPMDAVFLQTGGGIDPDGEAADKFAAQARELTDNVPTFHITRAVDILIDEKSGGYDYDCTFRYGCTIDYPGKAGVRLSPVSHSYSFYKGTRQAGAQSLAALYFFFNPYYPSGSPVPMYNDTITVTHNTDNAAYTPVSVFLAKQAPGGANAASPYKLLVQLKGNGDNNAQNTTVYCNAADSVLRIFRKEGVWYETAPNTFGSLVATEQRYRRYAMTVELYDNKGSKVYALNGSKLG